MDAVRMPLVGMLVAAALGLAAVQPRDEREVAVSRVTHCYTKEDTVEQREKLERIIEELDALDTKVAEAVTAVIDAQTDVARANVQARLVALQREQYEMKQRARQAQQQADFVVRRQGLKISKECMVNPLAQGCS